MSYEEDPDRLFRTPFTGAVFLTACVVLFVAAVWAAREVVLWLVRLF